MFLIIAHVNALKQQARTLLHSSAKISSDFHAPQIQKSARADAVHAVQIMYIPSLIVILLCPFALVLLLQPLPPPTPSVMAADGQNTQQLLCKHASVTVMMSDLGRPAKNLASCQILGDNLSPKGVVFSVLFLF